jgi:hydroxymethylpyrimidine/phosphomethylpyrimidine kinase
LAWQNNAGTPSHGQNGYKGLNTMKIIDTLTIAGFDPCGGAGVLADVRVMQHFGARGQGAITANTIQNEDTFLSIDWIPARTICDQIKVLLHKTNFKAIKIGLIQNANTLLAVLELLQERCPKIPIIWDPILKASAGYNFRQSYDYDSLQAIFSKITLITPNRLEVFTIQNLGLQTDHTEAESIAASLSEHCCVLLKDGHGTGPQAKDRLYLHRDCIRIYTHPRLPDASKHGTGCVYSSAVCANLAKGQTIEKSCGLAKDYMQQYLQSTDTLLGWY